MYHPSRGGVRGGADQFNWDDVKGDKYRENYLGHSLKAPVGRWQKGRDLSWYSKDRNSKMKGPSSIANEQLAAIKAAEEEAMQAALGHKPIKKPAEPLSKDELTEALQRTHNEREGERIAGVGKPSSTQAFSATFHIAAKKGVAFQGPTTPDTNKHIIEDKSQSGLEKSHRSKSKTRKHKKSKHKRRADESSSESTHSKRSTSKSGSKRQRHDSDSSE